MFYINKSIKIQDKYNNLVMFVFQEECKVTFECMKIFLLLIPSLLSQGALCYFGQKLENNVRNSVNIDFSFLDLGVSRVA